MARAASRTRVTRPERGGGDERPRVAERQRHVHTARGGRSALPSEPTMKAIRLRAGGDWPDVGEGRHRKQGSVVSPCSVEALPLPELKPRLAPGAWFASSRRVANLPSGRDAVNEERRELPRFAAESPPTAAQAIHAHLNASQGVIEGMPLISTYSTPRLSGGFPRPA